MKNISRISDIGEFGLIEYIKKLFPVRDSSVIKGIGDDCAVIKDNNKYKLLTTDTMVEDVHFSFKWKIPGLFFKLGKKLAYANISDIAAMGGAPKWALLTIGMKSDFNTDNLKHFLAGIKSASAEFKISIIGGDLVKSGRFFATLALFGTSTNFITRDKAKKGNYIYITGRLGRSAEGLRSLRQGLYKDSNIQRHLCPRPRLEEINYLLKFIKPTAMIDISDGFLSDFSHILKQSGKGAKIYIDSIPGVENLSSRLSGGEDYELIITTSQKISLSLVKKFEQKFRLELSLVGIITKEKKILLIDKKNRVVRLSGSGFDHYLKK